MSNPLLDLAPPQNIVTGQQTKAEKHLHFFPRKELQIARLCKLETPPFMHTTIIISTNMFTHTQNPPKNN